MIGLPKKPMTPEHQRLAEDATREKNWKRWGPYLSERQWGTVREDYSSDGAAWEYFPFEHAHLRAPRWGEDGLLGITDRQCRLCFSLALWNGNDKILKERLYGLTNHQGNHGEDVKEEYFYLDSTPTHSYLKGLYKYPVAAYPYDELIRENAARGRDELEFELHDSEAFSDGYYDVQFEMAKADDNDLFFRVRVTNHSEQANTLVLLPTLWFRNRWSWGQAHEGIPPSERPSIKRRDADAASLDVLARELGTWRFDMETEPERVLFTENESNHEVLFDSENESKYTKDAFHHAVIRNNYKKTHPERGSKAAPLYRLELEPGGSAELRFRLYADESAGKKQKVTSAAAYDKVFAERIAEADAFYDAVLPKDAPDDERAVARQAYAGLMWTKQFYHYIVQDWKEGDDYIAPPATRNLDWNHFYARDIISMPDKWEYPWFAAWDLAFHVLPIARIDPAFAKEQLTIFLREWYLHPNGQIPAYEWNFSDVNPPVHAWACWRVFQMSEGNDRTFLAGCFQKLLINFTWWVNRKDENGNNLFSGGFLGLDNIGVFDRSHALPPGSILHQADGTAWMGFYCLTMLGIALDLAVEELPDGTTVVHAEYGDMASKFFEHFMQICDAINELDGDGLWCEDDGFYYDELVDGRGRTTVLPVRSLVGLMPLIAAGILDERRVNHLPGFKKRFHWFLKNRPDLARHITEHDCPKRGRLWLLAMPARQRLERILPRMFDEAEFLSPFGIRGMSKSHEQEPFSMRLGGETLKVQYTPGESDTGMFGGNSNWRGPVWFPINYLLAEAMETYHAFYGDALDFEYPTGSGSRSSLDEIARDLHRRLAGLFLADENGHRPCHGGDPRYAEDPDYRKFILFYEYFHGDTGRGLGASHQTGWTALVATCLEK